MVFDIVILIAVGLAGAGVYFLLMWWKWSATLQRLQYEGQVTRGTVVDLQKERIYNSKGRTSTSNYYAKANYSVRGKTYTRSLQISPQSYNIWQKGMTVEMTYLPSKPQVAFFLKEYTAKNRNNSMLRSAIVMFVAAVALVVLALSTR